MHRSGDEALSILTVIILDYAPGRRYHLGEWTDKKVAMRIIFNQRVICFPVDMLYRAYRPRVASNFYCMMDWVRRRRRLA